jgi:preprotein translocase subunit SecY
VNAALTVPNLGHILNWTIMMAFIILFCWLFAQIVELPAHKLARQLGGRIRKTRSHRLAAT